MHPIDAAVLVATLGLAGSIAVAFVQHISSKQNTAFQALSKRLTKTEERLDRMEAELARERLRKTVVEAYAEALHNWGNRAYKFIISKGLDFDPPPTRKDIPEPDN